MADSCCQRQEEEFIVKRASALDLQLNPLLHPL